MTGREKRESGEQGERAAVLLKGALGIGISWEKTGDLLVDAKRRPIFNMLLPGDEMLIAKTLPHIGIDAVFVAERLWTRYVAAGRPKVAPDLKTEDAEKKARCDAWYLLSKTLLQLITTKRFTDAANLGVSIRDKSGLTFLEDLAKGGVPTAPFEERCILQTNTLTMVLNDGSRWKALQGDARDVQYLLDQKTDHASKGTHTVEIDIQYLQAKLALEKKVLEQLLHDDEKKA